MFRRIALPVAVALVCLVAAVPILAGPLLQSDLRLEIISPASGSEIHGVVPIIGSAVVPSFQFYKVEWGIGPNPSQWAVIGNIHDQQVTNNQLEVWDTNTVPDDVYTLRLTGVKTDGNWEEYYVRNLRVTNSGPVATATPSATATPNGTVTVTPTVGITPTPGTPELEITPTITAGVQIIAPTAALVAATATPKLDSGETESLLPFDTAALKDAFVFGGLSMAAVFVLVGIVFGIRRLL